MANTEQNQRDENRDPITGAPGAHPVGVGIGAAGGGATGAAIGTAVAGPVGTAVGAVIGAVAGGLAGKGVAEKVDPTAEEAYWRDNHGNQPYASDRAFDDYAPAYRAGYEGYSEHSAAGRNFNDAEPELRRTYESRLSETGSTARLDWADAKHAARAAWDRVDRGEAVRVPITEEEVKVGKREVEKGAVRIRKEVHTETVNQPVELRREEVVVERVAPGTPGAVPEDAFKEGEIRVPLKEEEAVVQKTAKVTGEVRLRKEVETETKNIQETVRKEEVRVENEGDARVRDNK